MFQHQHVEFVGANGFRSFGSFDESIDFITAESKWCTVVFKFVQPSVGTSFVTVDRRMLNEQSDKKARASLPRLVFQSWDVWSVIKNAFYIQTAHWLVYTEQSLLIGQPLIHECSGAFDRSIIVMYYLFSHFYCTHKINLKERHYTNIHFILSHFTDFAPFDKNCDIASFRFNSISIEVLCVTQISCFSIWCKNE